MESGNILFDGLTHLTAPNVSAVIGLIKEKSREENPDLINTLLRLAILSTDACSFDYLNLSNIWKNAGSPTLKPNSVCKKIRILTDFTANYFPIYLSLFCEAKGVHADISLSAFDSVEQESLNPSSDLFSSDLDFIVICLSEYWLRRYLGNDAVVSQGRVKNVCGILRDILESIKSNSQSDIIISNFCGFTYSSPSGMISCGDLIGRNLAILEINRWLARYHSTRVHIADLADAIFSSGGGPILGTTSYLRAKMAFEPIGEIAATREIASILAHLSGKSHRAVVTDLDNTLWGGVVAEAGTKNIVCGHDTADGLGYRQIQQCLGSLKSLGILLAIASRNTPSVLSVFEDNQSLFLKLDDFISCRVDYIPKSESINAISDDLGFGPEFMVFIDDSLFELAEVLSAHPSIDVIHAGKSPVETLKKLASARIGNASQLSEADLKRDERASALREQRQQSSLFKSLEEFLESIHIKLVFEPYSQENKSRVLQMFKKTNQFNLTTRRHTESTLSDLLDSDAKIAVVSYQDSFGEQGIISVVVLLPEGDRMFIESWLMSCCVLNRRVEHAVMEWIETQAHRNILCGHYIPTGKNEYVRCLYMDMGFEKLPQKNEDGAEYWERRMADESSPHREHFAEIVDLFVQ